jgi:hypothetical protein
MLTPTPVTPVSNTRERLIALAYAGVVWLTLGASLLAFAAAIVPNMSTDAKTAIGFIVVGTLIADIVFSSAVLINGHAKMASTTMSLKKAFEFGSAATLSLLWDIGALALALMDANPIYYAAVGVALLVDTAINIYVHVKR